MNQTTVRDGVKGSTMKNAETVTSCGKLLPVIHKPILSYPMTKYFVVYDSHGVGMPAMCTTFRLMGVCMMAV